MTWTDPRTWLAGEQLTAELLNTHVRDQLDVFGDPWPAFTPTLGNWTLGNGTLTGKAFSAGKLTMYRIDYVVGSTDTKSGSLLFSLPANISDAVGDFPIGQAIIEDVSAGTRYARFAGVASVSQLRMFDASVSYVTEAAPFTFATGDKVTVTGTYEAA